MGLHRRMLLIVPGLLLALVAAPLVGRQQAAKPHVYVAIYEKGSGWIEGKPVQEFPNFPQHLEHIRSIGHQAVGAGPFVPRADASLVGMVVLLAQSDDEARKLAESDPFVAAKYTQVKVWRWEVDSLRGCF